MKLIILALFLSLSVYCVLAANTTVKVETWGTITNHIFGTRRVTVGSIPLMVRTKTLKFPEVR